MVNPPSFLNLRDVHQPVYLAFHALQIDKCTEVLDTSHLAVVHLVKNRLVVELRRRRSAELVEVFVSVLFPAALLVVAFHGACASKLVLENQVIVLLLLAPTTARSRP